MATVDQLVTLYTQQRAQGECPLCGLSGLQMVVGTIEHNAPNCINLHAAYCDNCETEIDGEIMRHLAAWYAEPE